MLDFTKKSGTRTNHGLRLVTSDFHFTKDDPLTDFGKPGVHHTSIVVGNRSFDHSSTPKSLAESPDSYFDVGPHFGDVGWIAALEQKVGDEWELVEPDSVMLYYKSYKDKKPGQLEALAPLPAGFAHVSRKGRIRWTDEGRLTTAVTMPEDVLGHDGEFVVRARVRADYTLDPSTTVRFSSRREYSDWRKGLHAGYIRADGTDAIQERIAEACRDRDLLKVA